MPRHESSRLKLSYGWLRGEDWWGDPVSSNFLKLDMLAHPYVLSMTEVQPPVNGTTIGDMYIVPSGALLAWDGHANELAVFVDTASDAGWIFCKPTKGVRARLANPASWVWFEGTAWLDESQDDTSAPPPLGSRYDATMSVGFEPEPGDTLMLLTIPEPMTLPDMAIGSLGRAASVPPSIYRLPIKRNGSDIGTILFSPTSVRATFDVSGNKVFASGDLLTITMPENASPGFENFSVTLRMLLQNNGG